MFRALLLVFLTIAAAEAACEGEQCAIQDGSTTGSVMLQVKSAAKSAAQLEDVEDADDTTDEIGEEDDMEEEMEDEDLEAIEQDDEEELAAVETEGRPRGKRRRGNKKGKPPQSAEDKAACPAGGRLVDGKCWHLSLPATSCEETCVEKDLQYDEATDLGAVNKTNDDAKDKCLNIAAKFGYPGKREKLMQWIGRGCGCVVHKVPAYGIGDQVRLNHGVGKDGTVKTTNAQCAKTSGISARVCACKKTAAIGGSCTSSSGCGNSYCKSGVCTKLLAQDSKCTELSSCTTGYCSPSAGKCSTLAWKSTQGAFARSYRKSGARRSKKMVVPNWEEMTKFPKGFCLGYYPTTTGCLIARGIDRPKTIAKAQQRCAKSAECKAVWCCATACPATTCYAVKAEAPNYKAKDCPDAPGSFHETKYPNTYYTKQGEDKADQKEDEPAPDADEGKTEEKEEAPEKDAEEGADEVEDDEAGEEGSSGKIYKQVKTAAMCKFARGTRYTRLKGERTVEDCAEAVKQRSGLAFAFMERRKLCMMAPKPFSECSMVKGKWDLYNVEAGAGDEDLEQE